MAAYNANQFNEIKQCASEPRPIRPNKQNQQKPQVTSLANQEQPDNLSLNHAVSEAKFQKKKSNSEKAKKHQQRLIDFINEGSGLSSEESAKNSRRRTPMTMPRTKITATTPLEQRVALAKLKQKLVFDDEKQNKEPRENNAALLNNYMDAMSISSVAASDVAPSETSDLNINRINERLNQVREYLTQATSMYVSLSIAGSDEPQRSQQMSKLAKLIQQLRIQEKGYIDLLQKAEVVVSEQEDVMSTTTAENEDIPDIDSQQKELQRLREQQSLLKKIVEQQKELEKLKERQSALLLMQENAELAVEASRKQNNLMNNQRSSNEQNKKQNQIQVIRNQSGENILQVEAEQKIMEWEKKLLTLQEKKNQMDQLLNTFKSLKNSQDIESDMMNILNEEAQEQLSNGYKSDSEDIESKVKRLNNVRERMIELKELITGYEGARNTVSPAKTDASRDNRLHAKTIQSKGGAKMRNQNSRDNLNRPVPNLKLQNDIVNTPNNSVKNTNQENKSNSTNPVSFQQSSKDIDSESENDFSQKADENFSDIEDGFKWQDDPEFLTKVKKLKLAKQKLFNLQQLVKVVQEGNSPMIPINDLQNLALSFTNENNSECVESEVDDDQEAIEVQNIVEREDETENDDDADCEQTEDDNQSACAKTTENLTDNERRFQGLLRKQRLELNYLLKERERLLETHRKLDAVPTLSPINNSKNRNAAYSSLTKEKLKQQEKPKSNDGVSTEPQYGSEKEYSMQSKSYSEEKEYNTHPLSNPIAVSEIRRQRELYELQKKQKFVEKQQRKKMTQLEEIQSDDRGTYSVHSDEGVGVSAYSADVTTAATWGGSTAQSSNEEDSAVEDDYAATEECMENEEFRSHFIQTEEREEESVINNLSDQPRRGITWHQNDVTPNKIKNSHKHSSETQTLGSSVNRSLGQTPSQSRKLRQGNLTPAHKLVSDCKLKNVNDSHFADNNSTQPSVSQSPSTEMLHTQLASMCNSLLRNEQTLLSMLQNQFLKPTPAPQPAPNSDILISVKEFFERTNYSENFALTLNSLQTCFERVQQHQADMEYIHQQFTQLIAPSTQLMDYRSPWPNPPSLHLSSFGVNGGDASNNKCEKSLKEASSNPKETQTDTSLYDDLDFKIANAQPYSLFGETLIEGDLKPKVEEKMQRSQSKENFGLTSAVDVKNPVLTGDQGLYLNQNLPFPYQLRMSEYNPLSYQGNFASTYTGNVMTMSRMSMNKQHAETNISEHHEKTMWPSFFKIEDPAVLDVPEFENANKNKETKSKSVDYVAESTSGGNFSLFEAMRDLIYSEVATLIAMNESRPHYLLELFRELQLLNSDYLRQRGLYSLQELVTKFLTDSNLDSSPAKAAFVQETISNQQPYENWAGSEQTPSESVVTTDDEGETQALQSLAKQMENNEMYDYAEIVEQHSDGNLSTPRSSITDLPFASEDLGNTVINLDEALQKMKMYEMKMAETQKAFEQASNNFREFLPYVNQPKQQQSETFERGLNDADIGSVGKLSNVNSFDHQNSSVDTHLLNAQIKSLMMELVPFLNEHIDRVCTNDLLDVIRHKIVQLAQHKELQILNEPVNEQFNRFFHTQLDSVLKDSLSNFTSRKLKDCGEDILVVVSEILFNELAFFRLMNNLERPQSNSESFQSNHQFGSLDNFPKPFTEYQKMKNDDSLSNSAEKNVSDVSQTSNKASKSSSNSSNNFVLIDPSELTDEDNESIRNYVKVELAVSETRPVQSFESDHDEDSENEASCLRGAAPMTSVNFYSQVCEDSAHSKAAEMSNLSKTFQDERKESSLLEQQLEQQNLDAVENENLDAVENENTEDERDLEQVERRNDESFVGQYIELEDDLQEDDLPEADMATENSSIAQAILLHLDGVQELAGEDNHILSAPGPHG